MRGEYVRIDPIRIDVAGRLAARDASGKRRFYGQAQAGLPVPPSNITFKGGGNVFDRELRELKDDRPRRRELTCLASGSLAGVVLGMLAGNLVPTSRGILIAIGASVGVFAGALIAPHVSLEEWNPELHQHAYVGTNSPDDDMS